MPLLWTPDERAKPRFGHQAQINRAHPLAHGLVGCWLFNERGGLQAKNLVNPYSCALSNGASWTTTRDGDGISFSGGARVNIGPATGTLSLSFPISVVAQVQASAAVTYGGVLGYSSNSVFFITISSGNLYLKGYFGSFIYVSSAITNPVNSHIVFCQGTASSKGYVNGNLLSATTALGKTGTFNANYIGTDAAGDNFNGVINYLYIYNRVLTDGEVLQLYSNPYCFIEKVGHRSYTFISVGPSPQTTTPTSAVASAIVGGHVVTGALTSIISAAIAAAAASAPTATGALSSLPTSSAATATAGGHSVTGSLATSPNSAAASGIANDPTVSAGAYPQTATPTSAAGAATAGGASTSGSLTITANSAAALSTANDPTVSSAPVGTTTTPSAAIASATAGGHSISGVLIVSPVSAIGTAYAGGAVAVYLQVSAPTSAIASAVVSPCTASSASIGVRSVSVTFEYRQASATFILRKASAEFEMV